MTSDKGRVDRDLPLHSRPSLLVIAPQRPRTLHSVHSHTPFSTYTKRDPPSPRQISISPSSHPNRTTVTPLTVRDLKGAQTRIASTHTMGLLQWSQTSKTSRAATQPSKTTQQSDDESYKVVWRPAHYGGELRYCAVSGIMLVH